jgi:hypothetical protein
LEVGSRHRSPFFPILDDIRELSFNFFLLIYVLWVIWQMAGLTIVPNLLAQMGHHTFGRQFAPKFAASF